jgi:hypothetical protein
MKHRVVTPRLQTATETSTALLPGSCQWNHNIQHRALLEDSAPPLVQARGWTDETKEETGGEGRDLQLGWKLGGLVLPDPDETIKSFQQNLLSKTHKQDHEGRPTANLSSILLGLHAELTNPL